jgi:hypothetical protein
MVTSMAGLSAQINALAGPMADQAAGLADVRDAIASYPDTTSTRASLAAADVAFSALPTPPSEVRGEGARGGGGGEAAMAGEGRQWRQVVVQAVPTHG